jgi:hypothetical protein
LAQNRRFLTLLSKTDRSADRAPDLELNESVWKSVRRADSPMPPPVRAGFVRPEEEEEEGDD